MFDLLNMDNFIYIIGVMILIIYVRLWLMMRKMQQKFNFNWT